MNEELKQRLEKLERENQELKSWKQSLESSHSIPLSIDQAFRARFQFSLIKSSEKGNNSEDQSVNEGGVATYNVLKEPDDFLEVVVDNIIYYIPVYNAL